MHRAGGCGARATMRRRLSNVTVVAFLDLAGKARFDLGERDRRRQDDAARRRRAGQLGHRENTARAPAPRPDRPRRRARWRAETRRSRRHDFSQCGRDRRARANFLHLPPCGGGRPRSGPGGGYLGIRPPSPTLPRKGGGSTLCSWRFISDNRSPPLHHGARILGTARAVAAELIEPMVQIDIVAAEAAFGEHRGDARGKLAGAFRAGIDHHTRQPRRQRQSAQPAALLGYTALRVDGAELAEQRLRLAQRRRRRRIEKRQLARIGWRPIAPGRARSDDRSADRISGRV